MAPRRRRVRHDDGLRDPFPHDYPLQGDFLAQAKNRHTAIGKPIWWMALPSHGAIHGAGVFLITGSLTFGIAELIAHSIIDALKCEGRITYAQDQLLHVACKVAWLGPAIALQWGSA